MPSVTIYDQTVSVAPRRLLFETLFHFGENTPLFFLAFAVELVEARGNLAGLRLIFHAEKVNHVFRDIHAACRIQARGDAESDLAGSEWARAAQFRDFQQRLKSGVHRRAQGIESQLGKDAVLASERNRIGNSGNGYNFHERSN